MVPRDETRSPPAAGRILILPGPETEGHQETTARPARGVMARLTSPPARFVSHALVLPSRATSNRPPARIGPQNYRTIFWRIAAARVRRRTRLARPPRRPIRRVSAGHLPAVGIGP